jgi:hypothetical protein
VLRREVIVVDRTEVRCYVVERVTRAPADADGIPGRRTRTLSWFAPAYGLTVRVVNRDGPNEQTLGLRNLDPIR